MGATVPTYAEFITQYPVFASVTQASVVMQLSLSERLLDSDAWGDFYGDAIGLDAAHNLVIDAMESGSVLGGLQAGVGQITSSSAAGMSTSFASLNLDSKRQSEVWYSKTSYGQRFLRLRSVVIPLGTLAIV